MTTIIWSTGIAKNADFGFDIEIADGYSIVFAGSSEWPVPVGRSATDTYPKAHENTLKSLATRLLPLFYDKTKSKYSV